MVDGVGETVQGIFSGTGSLLTIIVITAIVGGFTLIVAGVGFWYLYYRKRWNLKVEIKLVRSNGQVIHGESGKGHFDAKRGVCFIKRPKVFKSIPMKIFDIRKYLQGSKLLTVIQLGPEDYRPVLYKSWTKHDVTMVNDETGEEKVIKESILNIEVETNEDKAWRDSFETASKKAYSITSFIQQFQTPIAVGIVVLCCFVGFAILWTRLSVT